MKRFEQFVLVVGLALPALVAPPVEAQRRIIGSDDGEESDVDTSDDDAPASPKDKKGKKDKKAKDEKAKDKKAEDKKAKDEKAKDEKAKDEKAKDEKAKDEKAKGEKAKDAKAASSADVLDGTKEEQARRAKEEEARAAAARAAEEAAEAERKKKAEEEKRLLEEKRAAEEKRRLENRDQRLAAARKVRNLSRTSGSVGVAVAVEPGEIKANQVLELRVDVTEKLEVADPRFGSLAPLKGLALVATVAIPTGKKDASVVRYLLHPVDAGGRYGFHFTPPRDGIYRVTIDGQTRTGAPIQASFQLHAGVWPPPDFEEEEKNNSSSADAARAGRKVFGN